MPVFRWGQSWDPFRDLEHEVDRLLQNMDFSVQSRSCRTFPAVNLRDHGDYLLLTAEVPGMSLSDLEVTVSGGLLSIKGVRQPPPEAKEDSFRRQERFYGAWQRSIQLPGRIREDELKAEYSAGVLRVKMPKSDNAVVRTIPVTEGPA